MSSAIMNPKMSAMDNTMIAVNRSKLMKLAEGIKTKKKPNHKKALNFKKDPGYTNIEHLVFGTYRPRNSPSSAAVSPPPPPQQQQQSSPTANGSASPLNDGPLDVVRPTPVLLVDGPNGVDEKTVAAADGPKANGSPVQCKNGIKSPKLNWRSVFPAAVLFPADGPSPEDDVTEPLLPSRLEMESEDGAPPYALPGCGSSPDVDGRALLPYQEPDGSYVVPVHALTLGHYVTREFSADFDSPVVCDGKPPKSPRAGERTASDSGKSSTAAKSSKHHAGSIYQTPCCLSSNSLNDAPSRSATTSPRNGRKSTPTPARPRPSAAGRASMKIPNRDPATLKDKTAIAANWSFRAAAKGKTGSARYGPPVRSASVCATANGMTKNGVSGDSRGASNWRSTIADDHHPPEAVCEVAADAPPPPRKELGLSCSSKESPASSSVDVPSKSASSSNDEDAATAASNGDVDRFSLGSGSLDVEKVPLSVLDVAEGTDLDDAVAPPSVDPGNDRVDDEDDGDASVTATIVEDVKAPLACEDGCGPEITVTEAASEPVKSGCERSVPKCVRRIKAASSPVFVESRVDSWVSEGNLHRPWSQLCSDRDVERLVVVAAKSCGLTSGGSMATGIEILAHAHPSTASEATSQAPSSTASGPNGSPTSSSQGNVFARFSSMRTPAARPPPGSPVEGVLQKFRKSFSARFYKKVKSESPPSPPPPPQSSKMNARHASFSSYLDDGADADPAPDGNGAGPLTTSSYGDISTDGSEGETIFRLGPIVWRSSKEKKENGKKLKKEVKNESSSSIEKPDSVEPFGSADANPEVAANATSQNTLEVTGRKSFTSHPRPNAYHNCVALSPHLLRRRSQSTTLHPERLKRPLSDQSGALHGSIILSDSLQISRVVDGGDTGTPNCVRYPRPIRNGSLGPFLRSSSTETSPFPTVPVVRRDKRNPTLRWSRGRSNLRRSVSQPLEMEKLDGQGRMSHSPGGLSDHEDLGHDLSAASSEEEIHCDLENDTIGGRLVQRGGKQCIEYVEPVLYAEALWDHVTMDPEELAFKVGELVEVLDVVDDEWWWGVIGNRAGWFPASFVRPRVNQESTVEDCVAKLRDGTACLPNSRTMSISLLSNDQIRTNVIKEIISTERDFVRHLKDVCEGYLKQMRKRLDMFPEERINVIFGNIEQLYAFQNDFVSKLEQCINWEHPHLSQIGSCFTEHREGFEIYSEYCNNHPQAVSELQQLYTMPKYAHFFEACRLLQDMIDISLDGFLLTPVQKICKYPLQLAELLKYTKPTHSDYQHVSEALDTMRNVAHYINERKRRMECLEKLAAWQMTVEYWEGPDLLDDSSELIYSGDVNKVTASWSRDFTLFLFDHQMIICKKDLLKRNSYSYKGRIHMDTCELKDIPDGKDTQFGLNLKNAWKLYCLERGKWVVFATRTAEEKRRWMKAFEDERRRVDEDKKEGFIVSDKAKKTALMAVLQNRKKPKRPKDKENKNLNRRLTRPDVYIVSTKSSSLPSNVLLGTNKKKTTSGWFHFGSNKKTKR